jgi:O-antigen/teichoic acid export membrane protein
MVLAAPVLTRLYSPEEFGLLAVYISLLSMVAVIASLRYQLAIPLPKDDKDAAAIVILSLLVVLGMSGLIGALVWGFGHRVADALNTSRLVAYLWLIPVGVLLAGAYQVFNYWTIRAGAFPVIARTKLTQAVSLVIVQIAGCKLGPVALLLGHVASQAAGLTSLAKEAGRQHFPMFLAVRLGDLAHQARRFRRFPIYSTWGGLFNTAGSQIPPILFAALFSPAAAGIYSLAERTLSMPVTLVGQAIAQVFLSDAAEARRKGELARLVATIYYRLAKVAMPPLLIVLVAGPDLLSLVFGTSWRQAGVFAQWMAPWLYLVFIAAPLSNLFFVMEKQAQDMIFQILLLSARLIALLTGAWLGDLIWAVALFALVSFVCWSGLVVWIVRTSGNSYRLLWVSSTKSLIWAGLLVSPVILAYIFSEMLWIRLCGLLLAGVLVGSGYFLLLRETWRS